MKFRGRSSTILVPNQLLKKQLHYARISLIVAILIVVVIGELGRRGYLPDGREVFPTVQGLQGLLLIFLITNNIVIINKTKRQLSFITCKQVNTEFLKKEFTFQRIANILLMITIISGAVSNTTFFICVLLLLVVPLYTLYRKNK